MSGTRLAIVILGVADIPRALGFYRSVFGWTLEVETPVYVEFSLPDDMRLGLYQRDAFARNVNETIWKRPQYDSTWRVDGRLREAAKQAAERSGARVVSSQL